jgi:hypothetical protein
MKTLAQQTFVKEVSANHPFGAIINETDTNDGTPVVREVYNDLLVNNYKLLQKVGITANNLEDNEVNGYQIIEALQKLPNKLNDIEQILTLSGTVWSIPLPIELLPNKYFFFAKAADLYVAGANYTFKGTGATSYPFSSTGFKASDELLLILDQSGVKAYSLSLLDQASDQLFTVMGTPLAFNDSDKLYYQTDGNLISDTPSVNYLEQIIRVNVSNGTVILNDILITNGYALCFCFIPASNTYFFRQFALSDLSVSFPVTGISFSASSNFSPYIYAKQGTVYITNDANNSANDYVVKKYTYNPLTASMALVSTANLDVSFVKTSNAVVQDDLLFTLVSGVFNKFNLNTGVKTAIGDFGAVVGNLFGFNGKTYFGSGEVAKRWIL